MEMQRGEEGSASDEETLLASGLYCDFGPRPSNAASNSAASNSAANASNSAASTSNSAASTSNVAPSGSQGDGYRRRASFMQKLMGGGFRGGESSNGHGNDMDTSPAGHDQVQGNPGTAPSSTPSNAPSNTPSNDPSAAPGTAPSTSLGTASSSSPKSSKPRRRRGSHMMPEGHSPAAGPSPEAMDVEAAPAQRTHRMPATPTMKVKGAKPRRRRGSHAMPEGYGASSASPSANPSSSPSAEAQPMEVSAPRAVRVGKSKSTKPRRRRGSHMMPEGGKMPTSAELMAQKAAASGATPAAAPAAVPTTSPATTPPATTTIRVKGNKPRRRRGSHMMPEGMKIAPSQDAQSGDVTTAHRPKYTASAVSAPSTASPMEDKMDESDSTPVTMKVKTTKPRRRRGSHMMPENQMEKLSMTNMSPSTRSMNPSTATPTNLATNPSKNATMTPPPQAMDHSTTPTPMDAETSPDNAAPLRTGSTMKMDTDGGSPETMDTTGTNAAADTAGDAVKPPHTRARRRGSVVKTMMEGGKNVDGDGRHYGSAAASNALDAPNASKSSDPPGRSGEAMVVDQHLPQRRASNELDDNSNHKRPMLKQGDLGQAGSVGAERVVGMSTSFAGDSGKRARKKKDIGRKAIRSMAAELDYVHKVVPKSNDAKALIYNAIKPNILFRACAPEELVDLVDAFEPQYVPMNSIVIREGDEGDHFYVMERGGVDVFEKDLHKCSLYSGVAFGEIALLYGCPRSATVRAKYDCKLWVIDRRAFRGITAQHKRKRLELKLEFLKKVKIHDKVLGEILKPSEIHSMALATKIEKFRKGSPIVRQGERGDAFYMIEEGTVDVFIKEKGDRPVVTLKSGQFFGEKALLSSDTRTATCIASSDVKCMLLMREDFVLMLGDLQDLLDRSYIARDEALLAEQQALMLKQALPETQRFDMRDFDIKRTLGVGAFGFVKLVKWISSPNGDPDAYYALKCVSKQKIEEHKQQEKIKNEEAIMKELIHPFIARCYSVLEDEKGKYFLMEALCGGELCELLYHEAQFTERWSMFYSASVLTAFGHMHERKIAYRDLKPENLVLNTAGYVKIVDFGLAKKITSGQTYTFCGTPDYLAPEVILNEGYDWAVDYWGLGVLIYEMTAGVAPFYAESPMETYEKVLSGHVHIPGHFSRAAANLIRKLLHTSQSKRLGRTVGGARTVMCHPWYSGFDWDALMDCRMKVPYVPEVRDPDDQSGYMEESETEGFATAFF